jgi:hypothetical protein
MPGGGSKPGERRGGRKVGSKNKRTILALSVRERLEELGCDPLEILARIAEDPKSGADVRVRAAAELSRYLWPQRKAVELSGANGGPISVDVDPRQRLESILRGYIERRRGVPPARHSG